MRMHAGGPSIWLFTEFPVIGKGWFSTRVSLPSMTMTMTMTMTMAT